MSKPIEISQIASALTGGQPLDYKQQEDGSLVVIAHTGQKFRFTAKQVAEKRRDLAPSPKPPARAKKPAAKAKAAQPPKSSKAKSRSSAQDNPPGNKSSRE